MERGPGVMSRRGLLRTTWAATGVAVLATAGATVPWLRNVSVLGVRSGDGPEGVPINHSAAYRGVVAAATSAAYRLTVAYGDREASAEPGRPARHGPDDRLAPDRLRRGLERGRDLDRRAGARPARPGRSARRAARCASSRCRSTAANGCSTLAGNFSDHPHTLLALELGGEPLSLDHGFPCRLIAPDRPGVLQTKWVGRLEVTA